MEIVDLVTSDDQVIGNSTKEDARAQGHYTRVSFIILLNSKNELFLQQRKSTKKTYPLYWSGSAAGHVQSGESYLDAAVRETQEELGVRVALKQIGKFTSGADKEIVTVFIGKSDGPFTLEVAAIERAEYYSLARLNTQPASMKMTSYLKDSLPLVSKTLHEPSSI